MLKSLVRESDIVGRYGGDNTTVEGGGRCGKRMARHLARVVVGELHLPAVRRISAE